MSVLLILILASLLVALSFLAAFWWSVRSGQFDDTGTPPLRIISDDETPLADPKRPEET